MVKYIVYTAVVILLVCFRGVAQAQPLAATDLDSAKVYRSIESALSNRDSVFRLDLSKQKLSGLPDEVFQFVNLQELRLNKCRISSLPDRFLELPNLQMLYCEHNEIDSIPQSLMQLSHLKVLDLADNLIETIPEEINRLGELETLALWDNPISYYPEGLTEMPGLRVLDVLNNAMSQETQERLKSGLPNCKIIMSPPCACMDGED